MFDLKRWVCYILQVWLDLSMFHFALKGIDNDLGNSKINRRKIRYLKYNNGLFQKRSTLPLPLLNKYPPPHTHTHPTPPAVRMSYNNWEIDPLLRQESPIYTDHESQQVNMRNGYCSCHQRSLWEEEDCTSMRFRRIQ